LEKKAEGQGEEQIAISGPSDAFGAARFAAAD
jgi:hypothetical protein